MQFIIDYRLYNFIIAQTYTDICYVHISIYYLLLLHCRACCLAGAVEPETMDNVVLSAVLTMCTVLALMLAGCLCCRRRSGSGRRDRFRRGVGGGMGGVGVAGGGYNRHRRHHQHHHPHHHEPRPPSLRSLSPTPSSGQHVCDELGERFASVDSV